MCEALSPCLPDPIRLPTFVASTTCVRLPLRWNHLPSTDSDSPPTCPGIQAEYTSAVSMKFVPPPTQASSNLNAVLSSMVQPNTLPPKASGDTRRDERPSGFQFTLYGPLARRLNRHVKR